MWQNAFSADHPCKRESSERCVMWKCILTAQRWNPFRGCMGGLFLALSERCNPIMRLQYYRNSPPAPSRHCWCDAEIDGWTSLLSVYFPAALQPQGRSAQIPSMDPSLSLAEWKKRASALQIFHFAPKCVPRGGRGLICFLRLHLLKLLSGASCRLNIYWEIDINGQRRPLSSRSHYLRAKWRRQRIWPSWCFFLCISNPLRSSRWKIASKMKINLKWMASW